jgi:hypothetical protein
MTLRLAALAAIAATGAIACELVTDLKASDYRLTPSACSSVGAGSGQLTSGNATCDACLAAQCCTAAASCFTGTTDAAVSDCASIEACFAECALSDSGSGECRAECIGANPGGLDGVVELSSCAAGSCASAGCTGF